MPERDKLVALAAAVPAALVRRWKAITGGKAIVVSHPFSAPEIVHSFGMLPIFAVSAGEIRSFRELADGWIVPDRYPGPSIPAGKPIFRIPGEWPADVETALDLLEAVAEWAASVSGRAYSEGKLHNSLAAYRDRDALVRLLSSEALDSGGSGLDEGPCIRLRCVNGLPVEAHALLIVRFLKVPPPSVRESVPAGEGDPLLQLARRTASNPENR